jgi:diaminohydroxyphosphoribosylaminopyrimidine deaminase/5-amino-6-(5-phosphoribosylamino)uracil reductase
MPNPLFDKNDVFAMRRALSLAASVKGRTGDNPAVGAVVYRDGKILGEGRTHPPGEDHAEKDALKKAGKAAKGASMAVTLEPCCHTGRTGPCTRSIIAAGIKKVVVAVKDPNPKMNGRGMRELVASGIKVSHGLFEKEAAALNEDFFKFIRAKIPFVALKAAMTLNGLIAADNGNSRWISSPAARKKVHALRNVYDAVLVGMNTVRCDDPLLTVRHVKGRDPIRVVLSSGNDLPPRSKLAKSAGNIRTILVTSKKIAPPACKNVEYYLVSSRSGDIDARSVLKLLAGLGIKSVLVEGGSAVFTAFIGQKCVDIFYLFMSPGILMSGAPFVRGRKTSSPEEAVALKSLQVEKSGGDLLITGRPGD